MTMARNIEQHLDKVGIRYDLLTHPHSQTSLQSARMSHLPPGQVAKAILTHDGEKYLLCVIPSGHRLVLSWVNSHMHGHYNLVQEEELSDFFNDCETGAVPALGQVYGLPVVWDETLGDMEDIYIESGDHEHLIHVDHGGFLELMGRQQHMILSCQKNDYSDHKHH